MKTPFIERISNQSDFIESWFEKQWLKTLPPLYCSVDLRYSGFKLAPVDTNLFPAGFNLLPSQNHPVCIQAFKTYLNGASPDIKKILLIPENHTRNLNYLENVAVLIKLLKQAGFDTRIGSLIKDIESPLPVTLPSGKEIILFPIQRQENRISIESFDPQLIILNHDLSDGIPDLLKNLDQPILPPLTAGWSTRLKSVHFKHYQDVAEEFGEATGIDPWLLFPLFHYCGEVNFMEHGGEDCIFYKAEALFEAIQKKYDEYGLTERPFLMVKSDTGTYGMGVMTLHSPEDIHHLNRKERTRMAAGKGGVHIHRVIIQEGVYTAESSTAQGTGSSEAVVYMIGKETVGGFYRIHPERQKDENLNAPGMFFDSEQLDKLAKTDPQRFYAYCVSARLALLAAARELKESPL